VAVGGAIGYFLDKWLHTAPWLLIVLADLDSQAASVKLFGVCALGDIRDEMSEQPNSAERPLPGEHILHRIAWLTLGFGFVGAAVAFATHRPEWAKGIVCGTGLGWLNFRWLKRGMLAMVQSVSKDSALASSPDGPETTENKDNTRRRPGPRACSWLFATSCSLSECMLFCLSARSPGEHWLGIVRARRRNNCGKCVEVLKPAS